MGGPDAVPQLLPIQAQLFGLVFFFSFLSVIMVYSCPSQIKRASTPDPCQRDELIFEAGQRGRARSVSGCKLIDKGLVVMFLFR